MLKLAGEFIEGQLADHQADLDAHTKNLWEVVGVVGQYVIQAAVSSSLALVANYLYAGPFYLVRTATFDRIGIKVNTEAAGKHCRLGIYSDSGAWAPSALVLDGDVVDVGTTGVKEITINQQLTKGIYWLAVVSDGTPTLKSRSVLTPCIHLATDDVISGYKNSHTYGALPDPFAATPGRYKYSSFVWLRLASID